MQDRTPPGKFHLLETLARRAQSVTVMVRPLLQLLLALSLILNGISAPWAMARMNHGDHAQHGAAAHAGHAEHAGAHHGHDGGAASHGADHGQAVADADPAPAKHGGGSCCDGTTCQCGCVLPPVVPFIGLALAPHALIDAAFVSLEQHAVARRGSPPFRPPAV